MFCLLKIDCQDLRDSGVRVNGVYKILIAKFNQSIDVYCEFENAFGNFKDGKNY